MKDQPASTAELLDLLDRIAHGDSQALGQLYDHTAPRLYSLLLRMLRDPSAAQEALQDCYIRVWKRAETYMPQKGDPLAWLTGIARYRALDLLRAARDRGGDAAIHPDKDPADTASDMQSPEDSAVESEGLSRLGRCIRSLPEEQRKSVLMAYYEGYSHAELAQKLHAPLGTVKAWVRRGLKRLKLCMEQT